MSKHTTTDFAEATFATHPDGQIAMRCDPQLHFTWDASGGEIFTDEGMAERGWTPARVVTTPREALAALVDLAYEPEGDVIPAGTPFITAFDDGTHTLSAGVSFEVRTPSPGGRRLLLDPPAPAWQTAELVEAAMKVGGERRYFWRIDQMSGTHWMDSQGIWHNAADLIDPQPLTVTKETA